MLISPAVRLLSSTSGSSEQSDPLLPGYRFHLHLVAGITPIAAGGPLDFTIDRPAGMQGFILNMTVRGKGRVFEGERAFACEPGDLLLFRPETPHLYRRHPDSPEWHHRWVYFRPRGFWAGWLQWADVHHGVGRMTLRDDAVRAEFESLFEQIDAAHRGGRPTSEELAANLLERLLIRCQEESPASEPIVIDRRVHAACVYIANHLARDSSLHEIARHVCLSPSRLAHLFRAQKGVSLVRWRDDQRMILAQHLLHDTDTPISVIAGRVGYEDPLYFSRVFKRRVGVSPSEFRYQAIRTATLPVIAASTTQPPAGRTWVQACSRVNHPSEKEQVQENGDPLAVAQVSINAPPSMA